MCQGAWKYAHSFRHLLVKRLPRWRQWAVVVQCPNCQSRFRVADEKVSDRGVRVRCSACKTVFAVRRSADANAP
ncbi:MAG TPA: zinc-ribbon domain-containing protein, partial [Myxococcales bacterium]|nr:zinc-ribbon domain-containing protein [Myxococcales bacterium]